MILPNTKHQLTNMEKYVLLKGHLFTVEGQHIISCNTLFSGRNIPLKARITRYKGIHPMLRGHMKCCPCDVNTFLLKGHTIPYLLRNVWYLVGICGSLPGVPLIVHLPPKQCTAVQFKVYSVQCTFQNTVPFQSCQYYIGYNWGHSSASRIPDIEHNAHWSMVTVDCTVQGVA